MEKNNFKFYEFFAGGGLARKGLGPKWECLFANDICPKKGAVYRYNFDGGAELTTGDIKHVAPNMLPDGASLAWASFPCQDLSLAGPKPQSGLSAKRSGSFWPFWALMTSLNNQGRSVPVIVLENVAGLLNSNNGKDFTSLINVITEQHYRVGAVVIDAEKFVPQSRPRLFIIAVKKAIEIPHYLLGKKADSPWLPNNLLKAYCNLPNQTKKNWVWWNLPVPTSGRNSLKSILDKEPVGVKWHSAKETQKIISLMSDTNLKKLKKAKQTGKLEVGAVYKRTRKENGKSVQRAEIRFDGLSGCLRTPAGGSSRQIILVVEGEHVRSRLLSPREAARLMGLDENYKLPNKYNEAYHLMGDAVVVPVVRWLEKHILSPICQANSGIIPLPAQNIGAA